MKIFAKCVKFAFVLKKMLSQKDNANIVLFIYTYYFSLFYQIDRSIKIYIYYSLSASINILILQSATIYNQLSYRFVSLKQTHRRNRVSMKSSQSATHQSKLEHQQTKNIYIRFPEFQSVLKKKKKGAQLPSEMDKNQIRM